MSYKFYALHNEELPEDNIFSKVLSGMKSVFNKSTKDKSKKTDKNVKQDNNTPVNCSASSTSTNSSNMAAIPVEVRIVDETETEDSAADPLFDVDIQDAVIKSEELDSEFQKTPSDLHSQLKSQLAVICSDATVDPKCETQSEDSQNNSEDIKNSCDSDTYFAVSEEIQPDLPAISPKHELHENELLDEQIKSHKSKHTPKKKSRKKTRSKEDEERNDSETDDPLDTSKLNLDQISPAADGTKPRIVLTFRSEKTGLRSTNVKIVTDSEKTAEENSGHTGRRSLRGKLSIPEMSMEPKKNVADVESPLDSDRHNKSANSESDDSSAKTSPSTKRNRKNISNQSDSNSEESPPLDAIKRSTRHRSREHSDNVLANAIARKEKFYNEAAPSGTTRLSRRIKPTAKVLANRELRIGFETQNNARLALVSELSPQPEESKQATKARVKKSPEKAKISTMSAPKSLDRMKIKKQKYEMADEKTAAETDGEDSPNDGKSLTVDEINRCILGSEEGENDSKQQFESSSDSFEKKRPNRPHQGVQEVPSKKLNKLKKKHLKKLGLKQALPEREIITDESTMDSTNTEAIVEHLNTRTKAYQLGALSQEEEDESHPEIPAFEEVIFEEEQNDSSDVDYVPSEEELSPRKFKKRKASSSDLEDSLPIVQLTKYVEKNKSPVRVTRKRSRLDNSGLRMNKSEAGSNSDDDEEAESSSQLGVNSVDQSSCLCGHPSNIYLDPNSVNEVEFCRAVDWVGGRPLGCGRVAESVLPLVRAGLRAPFFLPCNLHRRRLALHHCCPSCGAFCTQGTFFQCSEGHLFHWECGLPFVSLLMPPAQLDQMNHPPAPASVAAAIAPSSDVVDGAANEGEPAAPPAAAPVATVSPQKAHPADVYNARPGCPHCGLNDDTMEPLNLDCSKVSVEMKCTGPMILLPSPRLEWVPARMTFRGSQPKKTTVRVDDVEELDSLIREMDVDLPVLPAEMLPTILERVAALKDREEEDGVKATEVQAKVTELIAAVCEKENSLEKIMAALVNGADPRCPIPDADGGNSLHIAAREFNLCAVHVFRTLGCKLDAMDGKRRTPLMVAIISYDVKVKKIDQTAKERTGSKEKNSEEVKLQPDELKSACRKEFYAVLRYLIKAGSDPNLKGPEGVTALHLAAKNCDVATCSVMLENHAGVARSLINQRDDGGWTPLVWAAENNNIDVVRYLLDKGADPMISDGDKNVALHWAAVSGCSRSLEALLNAGCYVNVANIYGDTPLHVSARQDNYNCLIILLARGAKLDMKNTNGETPLDCVEEDSSCFSVLSINNQLRIMANSYPRNEQIITNDISNGKERNAVQCVNIVDDEESYGTFTYVTENCYTMDIQIDRKISAMEPCACTGRCGQSDSECACSNISIQSWYEPGGKLVPHFDYDDPPMIFECNDLCACNKNLCLNRGLTRGSRAVLQVFRCPRSLDKGGWGVRAMEYIQRGQLVSEYVGEILPSDTAYVRKDDSYLFQLEIKENIMEEETESYCIDARHYGNVSRFINHKCSPNIVPVRVFINHRDLRFPRIAFFACRDIQVNEEIGFDYGEKFWSVKRKSFSCQCGSNECKYSNKTEEIEVKDEPINTPMDIDIKIEYD